MANPEERVVSVYETSPLNDEDLLSEENEDDVGGGCGCFRGLCSGWRERGRYLLQQQEVIIRERVNELFTEVAAGPKWKTFIRRLSGVINNNNNNDQKRSKVQFQYDPQSYKLNFDDGIHGDVDHDAHFHFSARYAGINEVGDLGM